jgi:tRNA modification GTPase
MPQQRSPHARDKSGYLSDATIAAIATAVGGAIAMVRISGPRAFSALQSLLAEAGDLANTAEPRKLFRARLFSQEQELDDALFARFIAPESFTGENVVELHLHGGGFIASRVMETLSALGIRQALPGEFSFRAVRNGKMTLSQASAVADLIGATNPQAVSLALEKMSGTQNRLVTELAKSLRTLAVLGEVGIDFADQNVDEVSLPQLKKRILSVTESLSRLHSSYDRGFRIQDGIGVAFVGLPNAGKSSFFNALLGEDRSIVSEIPGTTRDVIRERITLKGSRYTITLRLEDTAGLRSAENEIEKIGIERTRKSARDADLILLLLDPTAPIEPALEQWRELGAPSEKTLGILTKRDLVQNPSKSEPALSAFGVTTWAETSSITGEGITQAIEKITSHCGHFVERQKGEVLLTRLDQVRAIEEAVDHLFRAQKATEIDLFASDIRQALYALGPLIGETVPDDILGQIFSEFCIGK